MNKRHRLKHVRASHLDKGGRPSWYRIENRTGTDVADVFIYDEIGAWGVTASDFVRDLSTVSAKSVNVRVNSPGGDVWDGIAIHNAIRNHSANVTVRIDGLAASAASFIAVAGDRVVIEPNAQVMIHDALCAIVGNAQELRELAGLLDRTSDSIAEMYAKKAGGEPATWREAMKAETWYNANEAVAAGLADEVAGADDEAEADGEADVVELAAHAPLPFLAAAVARVESRPELSGEPAVPVGCLSPCCVPVAAGPLDPDVLRAAVAVVAQNAPAPPPTPQRQPYLPPLPQPPVAQPEPEPQGPFNPDLIRAAIRLAAHDAPVPPEVTPPTAAEFDPVLFLSSLKEAVK